MIIPWAILINFYILIRPVYGLERQFNQPLNMAVLEFQNGGFEEIEDGKPKAWFTEDLLTEEVGNFSIDSTIKRSGENSARLDHEGKGDISWSQKVKVEAGKNYNFSGWIKTDLDWEERNWARYELYWEDKMGNFVDKPLFSKKRFSDSNWIEIKWKGEVPKGTVAINIRANMAGNGKAWFDDVAFTEQKGEVRGIAFFLLGLFASLFFFWLFKKKNLWKRFKHSSFFKILVKIWIACYKGKED